MPVLAIAAIGSAVVGGISSHKAANAQQKAADAATAEQQRQYDLTRSDQKPWMDAGGKAITTLGGMVQPGGSLWDNFDATKFQQDPGYQFRLQQGQQEVEKRNAAKGITLGGGTLKDLTAYNSGMASQEYGQAYNRFQTDRTTRYNQLAGVSGAGQVANQTMAAVGQNTANNIGNNLMYAGNARASGYMGMGNAIQGGIQSLSDLYARSQNKNQGGGTQSSFPNYLPLS